MKPDPNELHDTVVQVLYALAECCAQQIQIVREGQLTWFQQVSLDKDKLIHQLTRLLPEWNDRSLSVDEGNDTVVEALNTYITLEESVQKALTERSQDIAWRLMTHNRIRMAQEGYEKTDRLFTPISRLFPNSSRYIDKRR